MAQNRTCKRKSGSLANSDNTRMHAEWAHCRYDSGGVCHTAHSCVADTGADAGAWGAGGSLAQRMRHVNFGCARHHPNLRFAVVQDHQAAPLREDAVVT